MTDLLLADCWRKRAPDNGEKRGKFRCVSWLCTDVVRMENRKTVRNPIKSSLCVVVRKVDRFGRKRNSVYPDS